MDISKIRFILYIVIVYILFGNEIDHNLVANLSVIKGIIN